MGLYIHEFTETGAAFTGSYIPISISGNTYKISKNAYLSGISSDVEILNDLSDVLVDTVTSGQLLKFNGTAWVNSDVEAGSSLSGLSDTTINSPESGQVLSYNGIEWINGYGGYSSGLYNVVWVYDGVGDDALGELGNPGRPFATISGAINKYLYDYGDLEIRVLNSPVTTGFDIPITGNLSGSRASLKILAVI